MATNDTLAGIRDVCEELLVENRAAESGRASGAYQPGSNDPISLLAEHVQRQLLQHHTPIPHGAAPASNAKPTVDSPGATAANAATKGSVRLLTKATAVQHAKDHIRCNSIATCR